MNNIELRNHVKSELAKHPLFHPNLFKVVVPATDKMPSGKHGSLSYAIRSRDVPNNPMFLRACKTLLRYGGYIRIYAEDSESSLFVDYTP